MSNEVKAWIEGYKINLVNQITILRNRISLVNAMLLEFDAGTVSPAPSAIDLFEQAKAEAKAAKAAKKAAKQKPPAPVGESADKLIATALNSALGETAKPKRKTGNHQPSKAEPLVVSALEAAGKEGMTAREIAALTELPIGTASSRASLMARDGKVAYDPGGHRYFAIHSMREDNNLEA